MSFVVINKKRKIAHGVSEHRIGFTDQQRVSLTWTFEIFQSLSSEWEVEGDWLNAKGRGDVMMGFLVDSLVTLLLAPKVNPMRSLAITPFIL